MLYELTCLINPDLSDTAALESAEKLSAQLAKTGKIIKTINPKKIRLSYPIKKKTQGFLTSFIFELNPDNLGAMKADFDKNEAIIRFLLIKTKLETEKQPHPLERKTILKDKKIQKTAQIETKKEKLEPDKKPKKEKEKVAMENIETELNKILDESR